MVFDNILITSDTVETVTFDKMKILTLCSCQYNSTNQCEHVNIARTMAFICFLQNVLPVIGT